MPGKSQVSSKGVARSVASGGGGSGGGAQAGGEVVRDEMFVTEDTVSLCFLMNRRARSVRIVDFRAGPNPKKREAVLKLARQERMEKVYTVVERDEVPTWTKLGFVKEGNIPGFYKRSDAYLLGCLASAPLSSETRITAARPSPIEASFSSEARRLADAEEVLALTEEDDNKAMSPAAMRAEKTLAKAKRSAKIERALPRATVAEMKPTEAKKAVARAEKAGAALTAFEPFGRDSTRRYFSVTARAGFELVASVEGQACFGNAFLELLTAPASERDAAATTAALRALTDLLIEEGSVSVFSLVPSDDVELAASYVATGYRRTGVLENHIVKGGSGGARKDAILFSRKLVASTAD